MKDINLFYSYIFFKKVRDKPKTSVYECRSIKDNFLLGIVEWVAGWRRYAFSSCENAMYDASCLRDIANFLDELMTHHKKSRINNEHS